MSDFGAVADYGKARLGWTNDEPSTDHAERAVQLTESAATLPADNRAVPLILTEALVHAELAVADAQHTANLIAYLAISERRGATDDAHKDLDERVRERLDLA